MTRILTACAVVGLVACGDNPAAPTSVGFAPVDMAAFDSLVVGNSMGVTFSNRNADGTIFFRSAGRLDENSTYEYVNTGLKTGTLTITNTLMERLQFLEIWQLTFTTATSGTHNYSYSSVRGSRVIEEETDTGTFRIYDHGN